MKVNMEAAYPLEVEKVKKEGLPVILPVGTMEYHSYHCPYGCDTYTALGVAEGFAEATGGMVLPPVWYGVASYAVSGPEKNTINVDADTLEKYVQCILESLVKSGFRKNIYILIAHQTEDYMPMTLACMKAAKKVIMAELDEKLGYGWWGKKENADFYESLKGSDSPWNKIRVIRLCHTKSFSISHGDHAGEHECSMLEAVRPGSIKLDRLDVSEDWFGATAPKMDVEEGRKTVELCIKDLVEMSRE